MKKILIFLIFAFILSGCATYQFKKSGSGSNQGYLVTYEDESIPEYTIGKDKALPDLDLAKERFKRRKEKVEYYYKKMGLIESRVREVFWDPAAMVLDFIGGIFRWPYTAITDYKYNRDPKYKERMDKLDEEKDAFQKAKINSIKEKLDAYIAQDLAKEYPGQEAAAITPAVVAEPKTEVAPVVQEALPVAATSEAALQPAPVVSTPPIEPVTVVEPVAKVKPVIQKAPVVKISEPPVAVIEAKPIKGYSPLTVNFSANRSSVKSGKIISYEWDFGDGDTSTKKNPKNVYWSTTFGAPRAFTATLTVKDSNGLVSNTSSIIEVLTP